MQRSRKTSSVDGSSPATAKPVVVDSTDRYQSKVDSLQSVIDRLQEKEVTKVPWWSDWGWKLGVALVMCGLIIYTLVRLHNGRL